MRVAVLKGGPSLEREVSLRSGTNVEMALGRLGHEAIPIDADARLVRTLRDERQQGNGGGHGSMGEHVVSIRVSKGPQVYRAARGARKIRYSPVSPRSVPC